MLTRIEVDGFKNLRKLAIDLGPYTCIAGPNAAGKSNFFDALKFLSLSASHTLNDAAIKLRGTGGAIQDIFSPHQKMSLAAEMIVAPEFNDSFGTEIHTEFNYLRYELELALKEVTIGDNRSVFSIVVEHESLKHLTKTQAKENLGWASDELVDSMIHAKQGGSKPFICVEEQGNERRIEIHSGKRPSIIPLKDDSPKRTAVSVYGQQDQYPTVMAVKKELESWMQLSLEPSAMRAPSEALAEPFVTEKGGNLPRTLDRLVGEQTDIDVLDELAYITGELVDIKKVQVEFDEARQLFTLHAQVGHAPMVPARSLSDGTLRFLALGTLLLDTHSSRVICFEEPENGIHPLKIESMYWLLHQLSTDPTQPISPDNPLRQVIVNTHSPAFVYQHRDNFNELLIASPHATQGTLILSPVVSEKSWRKSRIKIPASNIRELLRETFPGIQFVELMEEG